MHNRPSLRHLNIMKYLHVKTSACLIIGLLGFAPLHVIGDDSGRPVVETSSTVEAGPNARDYKYNSTDGYYYNARTHTTSVRDTKTGFYIGVGISGVLTDNKIRTTDTRPGGGNFSSSASDFVPAPFGKVGFIFPHAITSFPGEPNFALELEGTGFKNDAPDGGKLETMVFSFLPMLSEPFFNNRARGYIGAGPSLGFVRYENENSFSGGNFRFDHTLVGLTAKIGAEYFFSPNFSIFSEYAFLYLQEFSGNGPGTHKEIQDDYAHQFRVGLGVHF